MAGREELIDMSTLPAYWAEPPFSELRPFSSAVEHIRSVSEDALSRRPDLNPEQVRTIETYLGERALAVQKYDDTFLVKRTAQGMYESA